MAAVWLVISVLAVVMVGTGVAAQGNGYCQVTKDSDKTAKKDTLPVLPVEFRTKVEANFVDKKLTSTIGEYYDSDGNRGALSILSAGKLITIIYNYATGEIFNIDDENKCVVSNITKDNFLFGDTTSDGRNHIFTSNNVMKLGGSWSEIKENKTTIRGITCTQWQTCQYWEAFNATFTVNYYFSDSKWQTSDNILPTPVRAHVKGQIVDWPITRDFEHIYEYFDFQMDIGDDTSIFQTPAGVVCPGRKKTKPIPSIPDHYYYRQEIITPIYGLIEYADVWYDFENKLVRSDYHHADKRPPFYNTHPVSEIHDFETGVAYAIDKDVGTCYTWFISNTSFDASFNAEATKINGSYVLRMRDPLKLLYLDDSYTFQGQTTVRGSICDRFVSYRSDFTIPGTENIGKMNTTFTYYFLSTDMNDVTNTGDDSDNQAPFRLEISAKDYGFQAIYNFLDFDEEQPPFTAFDVSSCYSEYDKVQFQLKFPTSYNNDESRALSLEAQFQLVETMQISPLRVQDVDISHDTANLLIRVTLLGPPPPGAEFTYIAGKELVKSNDKTISNVIDPSICAQYCVEETDFTCNSYDLCSTDKSCRLSKAHVDDGSADLKDSKCFHYSRTIDGSYMPQPTLLEAWGRLSETVLDGQFYLQIPVNNNGQTVAVAAVGVDILYGYVYDTPTIPSIPGQYYYREEIALPELNMVERGDVWYDSEYKLVRFDQKSTSPTAPFYSTSPMTTIHDFNTGIQYDIDKLLGNCTISHIQNSTFDTTANASEKLTDGSYVSRMKNPLELFYLDNTYKGAGQRTVRGILCDVFESHRTDFNLPGVNGKVNSTFQYFFMSDSWTDLSNNANSQAQDVPIRLDIIVPQYNFLATYSFFDFDVSHPDLKLFDVGACYNDIQKIRFQLEFDHAFHPFLDSQRRYFEVETKIAIAAGLGITPLRIQDSRTDYDSVAVYYTATLLDRSPPSAQYVLTSGIRVQHQDDRIIPNVTSSDVCATYCSSLSSFPCNSFDICPNAQICALSQHHKSDGKVTSNNPSCLHFSRDIDAPGGVEPGLTDSWDTLRDLVYLKGVVVKIPYVNKIITFSAISIKDVLFTDGPSVLQEENNMKKFQISSLNVALKSPKYTRPHMSVDDCATACIGQEDFGCEAFDYCFGDGSCYLSANHPDNSSRNSTVPKKNCALYGRNYVDDYTIQPGKTVLQTGAKSISAVQSENDCARLCEKESAFPCKSFDYCINLKRCVLGKQHVFAVPASDVLQTPECHHYSRHYVADFTTSVGKAVVFKDNYIINGVSPEECAKLCVEEERFSCKGFDFCGNTTQCRLTAPKLDGIGQITIQDSAYCNHFTRQYFPETSSGTDKPVTNAANPKPTVPIRSGNPAPATGYAGGTVAAISASMAVLACLITVIIGVLVQRRRGRRADAFSGTVNFTKHIDE